MVLIDRDLFTGEKVLQWVRPDGGIMQGPINATTFTWLIASGAPAGELRALLARAGEGLEVREGSPLEGGLDA